MKTVVAEYFATGEGVTHMVLVLSTDDEERARKRFVEIFGAYRGLGADVYDGVRLDKVPPALMSPEVRLILMEQQDQAHMEYHCSLHLNFS